MEQNEETARRIWRMTLRKEVGEAGKKRWWKK